MVRSLNFLFSWKIKKKNPKLTTTEEKPYRNPPITTPFRFLIPNLQCFIFISEWKSIQVMYYSVSNAGVYSV